MKHPHRSGVSKGSVTFAGDRAAAMPMSAMDGAYVDGGCIQVGVEES